MLTSSLDRMRSVTVKEFRQFLRDPVLLILVLWLYTVEIVICAVSLTFDLHDIPVAVLDRDRTQESIELAERFDRTPSFAVRYRLAREQDVSPLMDRGKAQLILDIPPGYGARVARADRPTVQLLADGSNSVTAMTALGDAQRLLAVDAEKRIAAHRGGPAPSVGIHNQVRIWYNPNLRFAHFVVISMIALAAFMVGVIHTAAMIVKEKERGTLEHLMVSPVSTFELLAAKALPTFVVGILALGPAMLVASVFDVPFRGSLFSFLVVSAAFLSSAIGIGIAIATLVQSLQQALLVAFFVLFPVMFLSGTMTPIESMPRILQHVSQLSPLRHYMEALLGVFLKGVGLEIVWPQVIWMMGLSVALFAGGAGLFRKRIV